MGCERVLDVSTVLDVDVVVVVKLWVAPVLLEVELFKCCRVSGLVGTYLLLVCCYFA